MNFNEILRKNITYGDIKSDKKKTKLETLQTAYFLKHILRVKGRIFLNGTSISVRHVCQNFGTCT